MRIDPYLSPRSSFSFSFLFPRFHLPLVTSIFVCARVSFLVPALGFVLLLDVRGLDGDPPFSRVLFKYGAEFVDVNEGFGGLCLGSGQAATHGVPELHARQEVWRSLGIFDLQELHDLRVLSGVLDAMVHKLPGNKEKRE